MRWGLLFVAPLAACGTLAASDDAGDASADATVEACASPSPFDCVDASSFEVAPPPPPVVCPTSPPTLGTPCTAPDYQDCEYGTQSFFCNQHFTCWSGQWQKDTSIPTLFCGTDEACSVVVDGGACQSPGQACSSGDASVCVCSECGGGPPAPGLNRYWYCFSPGAGCAVDRPNVGTTCDLPDGSACSYSHGGCCTGVYEWCTNGVWLGVETEPCP